MIFFGAVLGAKRLELLRQLVPKATTIGVLVNPDSPETEAERRDVQAAAQAVGQQLVVVDASERTRHRNSLCNVRPTRGRAVLVVGGAFIFSQSGTDRRAGGSPCAAGDLCQCASFVEAGGLMSYGASITDAYRQVGIYAGRILKGEKPAELPVMQATKFELVINLKTAKALGLNVPRRCSPPPTR